LTETQREVSVQYGSFGRKQLQTDLTGPLTEDGQWSYQLIALARKADTQVDFAAKVFTSEGSDHHQGLESTLHGEATRSLRLLGGATWLEAQ
jgi:hypothetical protein